MASKPKRSNYQQQRIVAALASGPMTTRALTDALHLDHTTVAIHLGVLHEAKQVHVCGHQALGPSRRPARLFALGNAPDVAYAPQTYAKESKRERQAELALELLALPMTDEQLADRMGIKPRRVRTYLHYLHKTPKQIHIAGWIPAPGKGWPHPVYAQGSLPDVPMVKKERRRQPRSHATGQQSWAAALGL